MIKNKLLVRSVLALVLVSVVVPTFAFVPLLARVVQSYISTPQGKQAVLNISGLALGTAIYAYEVVRQDAQNEPRSEEIYFTNTPRQPRPMEEQQGFTAGSPSLSPPTTQPLGHQYSWSSTTPRSGSASGACSMLCGYNGNGATQCTYQSANNNCHYRGADYAWYDMGILMFDYCPDGYVKSGTVCQIANPELVKPPVDGVCPIVRSGNTYAVDPKDPDCPGDVSPSTDPNTGVSVWHWTGSGDGHHARLTVNADGSLKFEEDIANPDGLTSNTTTITADAPADNADAPAVTGVGTTTANGTGSQTAGPTPTVTDPALNAAVQTGSADVVAAVNANTDAVNAAAQADATYRAGEQARFEQQLGTAPLPDVVPSSTVPVSITSVLFTSSAVCPADIPLTVMGTSHSISFAPMCDVMSYMRPLFLAFGAFSCAFIFIGGLKS